MSASAAPARTAPPPPPPAGRKLTKRERAAAQRAQWAAAKAVKAARGRALQKQQLDDARARRLADLVAVRESGSPCFDVQRPLPLAIGIDLEIIPLLGRKRAKRLLAWWCRRPFYQTAVAAGGTRHNLDGSVAGAIAEEHRILAARQVADAPAPPSRSPATGSATP